MKSGGLGLLTEGRSQAVAEKKSPGQETVWAERRTSFGRRGRQMCFTPVTPQASRKSQHLSSQNKQGACAARGPCILARPALGASSSTRHSHERQAAKGCKTAAASQNGETHISEVVRLLPRTCTLLSTPLGCEVFQKQKVILLQSRKGCFRQPAGKMNQHYSNSSLTKR